MTFAFNNNNTNNNVFIYGELLSWINPIFPEVLSSNIYIHARTMFTYRTGHIIIHEYIKHNRKKSIIIPLTVAGLSLHV